ncbi:JAML protein, partial [Dromaius novaehollandiae]|nr:JAML protein [Dromaius novaehollandiae]
TVFYYYSNHGVPVGRFRERAQWQGDISRWDGSIQLQGVQVNDSGTYVCEIRLLQQSSIFKNHTELHVSPAARRGTMGAQDSAAPGSTGFWSMVVGCCCVAVVLAFLAGLCLRKRYRWWLAVSRASAREGFYSSIPGAGAPKAEQDAGKKSRAEETYITMHPSFFRENGVYVELTRRVIPAEWTEGKRQADGESKQPEDRPPAAPPCAPEAGS